MKVTENARFILAILISGLVICIAGAIAQENSNEMISYDPLTGQETRFSVSAEELAQMGLSGMSPGSGVPGEVGRGGSPLDDFGALYSVPASGFPWRTTCKLYITFPWGTREASGVLIDPMHVLTAGHCVWDSAWASQINVVPAKDGGSEPYGNSYMSGMATWTGWTVNRWCSDDMGLIRLGRPVGALTGWLGIGYNNSDSWFVGRTFHNPGYPTETPYSGQYQYEWGGTLDSVDASGLFNYTTAKHGLDGGGLYYWAGGSSYTVYGDLSCIRPYGYAGTAWSRITSSKYSNLLDWMQADRPDTPKLYALDCDVITPLQAGLPVAWMAFVALNYSHATWNGSEVIVSIYLSTNSSITPADEFIGHARFFRSIGPLDTIRVQLTDSAAIDPDTPAGNYYIGVRIEPVDSSWTVSTTTGDDAAPVTVLGCPALAQAVAISPASDTTVCNGVEVNYCWHRISGIDHYLFQDDTDPLFSNPETIVVGDTCQIFALTGSGTHYWRVCGANFCRNGEWSGTRSITLRQAGRPLLRTPLDNAIICSGSSYEYCWRPVNGADDYLVQWDDNSSFSSPESAITPDTCCTHVITGSGTWYWRACARNECGAGAWPPARHVRPMPLTPPEVVIRFISPSIRLNWSRVLCASSYLIEAADSVNGVYSPITTVSDTSYTHTPGSLMRFFRILAQD